MQGAKFCHRGDFEPDVSVCHGVSGMFAFFVPGYISWQRGRRAEAVGHALAACVFGLVFFPWGYVVMCVASNYSAQFDD